MSERDSDRIVISGIGVVAANGSGKEQVWQAIRQGSSCIGPVSLFDTSGFRSHRAAEITDFNPTEILGRKGLRLLDRTTTVALCATKYALQDARLEITDENTRRTGVVLASTMGAVESRAGFYLDLLGKGFVGVNPAFFPNTVVNSPASQIGIYFKVRGLNTTVSNGFTGALDALQYAADMIRWKRIETVLVGGVETLNPFIYCAFEKMGLLSRQTETCKEMITPFGKSNNGTVLGEGAVMLVLESLQSAKRRNASIYAEIAGGRTLFDRRSYLRYSAKGNGLRHAVELVLNETSIEPHSIDFVSSSANGVKVADLMEARVIHSVLGNQGRKPSVTVSKSLFGETFSASGGFQIVYALFGLENNVIPPTLNIEQVDTECPVDCAGNAPGGVTEATKSIENVLVTSVSPMGYNAAVLLKRTRE